MAKQLKLGKDAARAVVSSGTPTRVRSIQTVGKHYAPGGGDPGSADNDLTAGYKIYLGGNDGTIINWTGFDGYCSSGFYNSVTGLEFNCDGNYNFPWGLFASASANGNNGVYFTVSWGGFGVVSGYGVSARAKILQAGAGIALTTNSQSLTCTVAWNPEQGDAIKNPTLAKQVVTGLSVSSSGNTTGDVVTGLANGGTTVLANVSTGSSSGNTNRLVIGVTGDYSGSESGHGGTSSWTGNEFVLGLSQEDNHTAVSAVVREITETKQGFLAGTVGNTVRPVIGLSPSGETVVTGLSRIESSGGSEGGTSSSESNSSNESSSSSGESGSESESENEGDPDPEEPSVSDDEVVVDLELEKALFLDGSQAGITVVTGLGSSSGSSNSGGSQSGSAGASGGGSNSADEVVVDLEKTKANFVTGLGTGTDVVTNISSASSGDGIEYVSDVSLALTTGNGTPPQGSVQVVVSVECSNGSIVEQTAYLSLVVTKRKLQSTKGGFTTSQAVTEVTPITASLVTTELTSSEAIIDATPTMATLTKATLNTTELAASQAITALNIRYARARSGHFEFGNFETTTLAKANLAKESVTINTEQADCAAMPRNQQ